jgi:hypothetical protein
MDFGPREEVKNTPQVALGNGFWLVADKKNLRNLDFVTGGLYIE